MILHSIYRRDHVEQKAIDTGECVCVYRASPPLNTCVNGGVY